MGKRIRENISPEEKFEISLSKNSAAMFTKFTVELLQKAIVFTIAKTAE